MRRTLRLAPAVSGLLLIAVTLVTLGCASSRVRRGARIVGPFTRAVLLFYEFDRLNPDPDSIRSSDALSWLTLERGKPKMICVLAFDEDDRLLTLERRQSQWNWATSDNVQVQRTTDGSTARVTLTDGDTGWLQVSTSGYTGDIRVLRQGWRGH